MWVTSATEFSISGCLVKNNYYLGEGVPLSSE